MVSTKGIITKKQETRQMQTNQTANASVAAVMNSLLDSSGIRKRIDELLGKRAAQLCSSLITIANSTPEMRQAATQAPMTILQTGLKAATYDLPLGSELGYAYPVAFYNSKNQRYECQYIMGYKGLYQLAMRTGVYTKLNVCDIREGELKSWNPLTEDIEIEFIEDEVEREKAKIVGYCGFFRTVTGMEKFVYWPMAKIQRHEERHRKGKYQNPVWESDPEAMSRKTVLRDLITHWGLMSIDYRTATPDVVAMATNAAQGKLDDEELTTIEVAQQETIDEERTVDVETGEIITDEGFTAAEIENAVEGK